MIYANTLKSVKVVILYLLLTLQPHHIINLNKDFNDPWKRLTFAPNKEEKYFIIQDDLYILSIVKIHIKYEYE